MVLKVIQGSGNAPSSDEEKFIRKLQLKTGSVPPRGEPYQLSSCFSTPDKEKGSMIYRFKFGVMETGVVVTIRVVVNDGQSGAKLAITDMATLPVEERGRGYGTQALQMLLDAVKKKSLNNVQAVQVQPPSEHFWVKNGFYALENSTNDYRLSQPP